MPSVVSNSMIPIPIINRTGDLDAVAQDWLDIAETLDKGLQVGHIDVSGEMAMKSMVLEHRYEGGTAEYSTPMHWDTSDQYVTWAFAARTAKTMQEDVLPNMAQSLVDGAISSEEFWDTVGRRAVGIMQSVMVNVDTPGNAPSTIRQKGFDNPLIETGEMMTSVSYRVVEDPDSIKGTVEDVTESTTKIPPAF